jgi:hypothetical protein
MGVFAGATVLVGLATGCEDRRAPPALLQQPVTVRLFDDGAPLAGRWVVFHDAEGEVLSAARSGPDGAATGQVPRGGMVTVAQGNSVRRLVTFTGVEPGDAIVVGEPEDEGGAGRAVGMARVSVPGEFPGAAAYGFDLGVGTTPADAHAAPRVPVLQRFLDGDRFRVLAEARDARGEPVAYAFNWAAAPRANAPDAEVQLGAWRTDFRAVSFVVVDAPAGVSKVSAELALVEGEHERFARGRREVEARRGATMRFAVPGPLGRAGAFRLAVDYEGGPDRATLAQHVRDLPAEVPVDLRAKLLPRVSDAVVDQAAERPTARWRVGDGAAAADATLVQVAWPETREHVWTVVAPPGASRAKLPALPAVLSAWRPGALPARAAIALVDASFYEGFADVRRKGIEALSEEPEEESTVRMSTTGDPSL